MPARLVDRLLRDSRLIFSPITFAGFESRLWKPEFDRYPTIELRNQILEDMDASAWWVKVKPTLAARRFSRAGYQVELLLKHRDRLALIQWQHAITLIHSGGCI